MGSPVSLGPEQWGKKNNNNHHHAVLQRCLDLSICPTFVTSGPFKWIKEQWAAEPSFTPGCVRAGPEFFPSSPTRLCKMIGVDQ
jgi:hypothetical protein